MPLFYYLTERLTQDNLFLLRSFKIASGPKIIPNITTAIRKLDLVMNATTTPVGMPIKAPTATKALTVC